MNGWMDKEDLRYTHTHTHTHTHTQLNHKKEWNFAICSNVNELGWHCAKWNVRQKDKSNKYRES